MSAVSMLKGCPLFHELYEKEIQSIVNRCHVVSFESGESIIQEGEQGQEVFIILSGSADVLIKKGDGKIKVAEMNKGDLFGELVLINENYRAADVISTSKTDLLVIDQDTIYELFQKNTKIFAVLLMNLARLLTKRLKSANEKIEHLKAG